MVFQTTRHLLDQLASAGFHCIENVFLVSRLVALIWMQKRAIELIEKSGNLRAHLNFRLPDLMPSRFSLPEQPHLSVSTPPRSNVSKI